MADHTDPHVVPSSNEAQELPIVEAPGPGSGNGAIGSIAEDMAAEAMREVQLAADRLRDSSGQGGVPASDTPELGGPVSRSASGVTSSVLGDVKLAMTVELGRTRMYVQDVLQLQSGAVIELDRAAGDPVDILVNGHPVARGEVIVHEGTFCIRISEILTAGESHDVA